MVCISMENKIYLKVKLKVDFEEVVEAVVIEEVKIQLL